MRAAVFDAIARRAAIQSDLWFLTGDLGFRQTDTLAATLGSQFINIGVGEQNLMSVAAGLALAGQRVVVYSIGAFGLLRGIEQFRVGIATHELNVTVICGGAGLTYGTLGFSHFALEDIAVLRATPRVTILTPSTERELQRACGWMLDGCGPTYLRLERQVCEGDISSLPECPDMSSCDAVVVGYGGVMIEALQASNRLRSSGCRTGVLSVPCFDDTTEDKLAVALANIPAVITVEEHSRRGGIGSLVAETLASRGLPARLRILGTDSTVLRGWGSHGWLRKHQGIDSASIERAVRELTQSVLR